MDTGLFFRGLLIGLAIAAPVGPIGVLCMRRTLAYGRVSGFVSGLGAATADAVYGSIAAFGLTIVAKVLVEQEAALQLVGGLFLAYLGIRTIMEKPKNLGLTPEALPIIQQKNTQWRWNWRALGQDFISTFLLTLTNPMTILSFAAIFAGLGAATAFGGGVQVVAGVFCGIGVVVADPEPDDRFFSGLAGKTRQATLGELDFRCNPADLRRRGAG